MDEEQKRMLGQLLVFGFHGTTATPEIKAMIRNHYVGNIILFSRNIETPEQLLSLTSDLQKAAKEAGHERPLAICVDQENGTVRRLSGVTALPGAMLLGATHKRRYASIVGQLTAKELRAVGVNWNLAPVADVNNNPNNPVIGVRSFGEDPSKVGDFAKEMMTGMQAEGVIATLKHFPGHGDTVVDSHHAMPTIPHSLKRLQQVELVPFKACIEAGAEAIMSAHIHFPALETEPVPATISYKVMTELLRHELGYSGVLMTDCLEMEAIAGSIGTAQGAVAALLAGADMLVVSHCESRQRPTVAALEAAFAEGRFDQKRLDMSFQRIDALKAKYLSWDRLPRREDLKNVGSTFRQSEANTIYADGVTAIGERKLSPHQPVLLFYGNVQHRTPAEERQDEDHPLVEALYKQAAVAKAIAFDDESQKWERCLAEADLYEQIIVATSNIAQAPYQQRFIHALMAKGHKPIIVATQNPYDYRFVSNSLTFVATYEPTEPAVVAALAYLFGRGEANGRLPVSVSDDGR
ncbi:beta-N-acetylhexosaminidase [Shouchella clausii]|uniref:beta-N-acetylhexosaminidase n=1 Tax=Shouchella clausii TaxID=79880 RepID=UPI000BA71142|nr:beta-N-acetylhexosaminidase [Shouchella clausii]PAD13440.1 beta-N-acetylhexosaminidase [Shouchella clausii]PAE82994.1 beta-N-acetylhexosaminidase [Shouchella clausii]